MKHLWPLLLALTLSACGDPSSPDGARQADWTAVDAALDDSLRVNGGRLPGVAFAIFDRHGTLHGHSGGNLTPDSALAIASASKMPAAAAILTLVDDGKLDLDAPIAQYIHAAGDPIVWPANKGAITMRMLLNHTSGLPGNGLAEPNCLDRVIAANLQQCAQLIARAPLITTPGAAFSYGGADFQLAGYVATLIASASSWQEFFNAAIVAPLGLTRFTYGDPAAVTNPRIAGGAMSDVGDYVRILRMVQNGGELDGQRVLSSTSAALLKKNQIDGLPILFAPFTQQAADNFDGYAFGFWISAAKQHPGSSGPELSDPGAFGATPWIDEDLGYGAVLLMEDRTQTGLELWDTLRPLITEQLR